MYMPVIILRWMIRGDGQSLTFFGSSVPVPASPTSVDLKNIVPRQHNIVSTIQDENYYKIRVATMLLSFLLLLSKTIRLSGRAKRW